MISNVKMIHNPIYDPFVGICRSVSTKGVRKIMTLEFHEKVTFLKISYLYFHSKCEFTSITAGDVSCESKQFTFYERSVLLENDLIYKN